jgi:ATP-binding cassette subfamily C protein CydC
MQDLCSGIALWAVLSVAGMLVMEGSLGPIYLALLATTALAGFEAVRPLGEALRSLGRALAAGERLFEISDSPPAVTDPENPPAPPAGRVIEFDGVTFRYEDYEAPVLTDVSFSLSPGKKTAVIGPSGAGKSTLVNLLLRFWDPTSGRLLLDGQDLRSYAQSDARAVLSVAAQDVFLFDDSLRENLLLAGPSAVEDELWSVLEGAQLGGFVEGLPRGLDTPVGELGTRLSGGERRRLAVARAFLKDAPFLVLDEPTADLDAGTERLLLEATHEHVDANGQGLFLITHRLVGMERMDEILVLGKGTIVERGTHAELIRSKGPYARMYGLQEQMLAGS